MKKEGSDQSNKQVCIALNIFIRKYCNKYRITISICVDFNLQGNMKFELPAVTTYQIVLL